MKKIRLTTDKLNEIISIYRDDTLSNEEKGRRMHEICSYRELEDMRRYTYGYSFDDSDLFRKVVSIYNYAYSEGLFDQYRETYKCSMEEAYARLDALKEIIAIIDSDIDMDQKISKLLGYYRNGELFRQKYSLFLKFGEKDPRLDNYRYELSRIDDVMKLYKKIESDPLRKKNAQYIETMEKLLEEKKYLENYLYAEFIVKKYIEVADSYKTADFAKRCGLTVSELEYCTELVKVLNPILSNEYANKVLENVSIRFVANKATFENLYNGIKTGYLNDGTPFNNIEFLKRIPFKQPGKNFFNEVLLFLKRNFSDRPDLVDTIIKYIYCIHAKVLHFVNEETANKNNVCINGVMSNPDINKLIFEYMNAYGLPKISLVYSDLFRKYTRGELDPVLIKEKQDHNEEEILSRKIDNPYTLIK